jgi:predicted nucleic acid-binding protein
MWLRHDIRHACWSGQRTVMVSAASQGLIRLFCSQHVIDEVLEHARDWSEGARVPVPHDLFMRRLLDEYLQVIRIVPLDGVPPTWLTHDEQARVDALTDRDDVPSVMLSLAVRGLYVSKDKRAVRAAYGDAADLAVQAEWLEVLKAGGDAGELARMLRSASGGLALAGYGAVGAARKVYEALGPWSVVVGVGGAYLLVKWLRQPSRRGLLSGFDMVMEALGEVVAVQDEQRKLFEAALPPVLPWSELAGLIPSDAVLGRACLNALARTDRGHLSAQELAQKISPSILGTEAKVRAGLRSTSCFVEVFRGRWQVGAPSRMANRSLERN